MTDLQTTNDIMLPTIMIKKLSIVGFLSLLLSVSFHTTDIQAQDMSIGFVDPRAILERMPEMRAVEQRLQNFQERKSQEFATKQQELQTEFEAYQQKIGVISDAARTEEEERLGQLQMELQQFETEFQQELAERQAELMSPLIDQMQNAIDSVAEQRNLDYVLNTRTSSGDMIILYVDPEVREANDITDPVMQFLDI